MFCLLTIACSSTPQNVATPANRELSARHQLSDASVENLERTRNSKKLIMYFNPRCSHCSRAKAWLDQRGETYELRNVQDQKYLEEFRALGGKGVPMFFRNGKELRGFEPSALEELLRG